MAMSEVIETPEAVPVELEGLDSSDSRGWGEYSLDSVFVRNESRSVADIIRRIDSNRCILDPEFQRDFVWPEDKQSKLIESCIMRIPLPVFYLAEATDGRIIIVDGLQRLTTFHRFIKGQFRLKGLSSKDSKGLANDLEGKRFAQLSLNIQERILDTQLITYILDPKAPERARLDIFERVNSGVPLTRQQMRNALYSGPATVWLKEAAQGYNFRTVVGGGLEPKTMRDREAINRFCAFLLLKRTNYRGEMDSFLARALTEMNTFTTNTLVDLRRLFDGSMRLNRELFKEHAFRKSLSSTDASSRRQVLNIALFDVCSVCLAQQGQKIAGNTSAIIRARQAIRDLLQQKEFVTAITYSTNSTQAVTTRFEMAEAALNSIAASPEARF
jgi:hypothetical protein